MRRNGSQNRRECGSLAQSLPGCGALVGCDPFDRIPGATLSGEPKSLEVNDRIQIPLSEFEFVYSRASGPGGQNVNKVSSRVQLRWIVAGSSALPEAVAERFQRLHRRRINADGVFQISSQRYRDQPRNRTDCLEKLALLVEEAARPPRKRKKTRVPRRAIERRLSEKKKRSEAKQRRKRPPLAE